MQKISNDLWDLWDEEEQKFNELNVQMLVDYITGKPNATKDDVEALFSGEPIYTNAMTEEASGDGDPNGTYYQEYSSKVVKSDLLNRNANKITPGIGDNDKSKGLCVTLNGKEFRVTSLTRTLPTAEKPDGDIVATLLLKEPEDDEKWNSSDNQDTLFFNSSNMYSASDIRQTLICAYERIRLNSSCVDGNYDFADCYLVKPNQIGYQLEQSLATRWKNHHKYTLPNEALGDVGDYFQFWKYYNDKLDADYYNNGGSEGSADQTAKRNAYLEWGEDFVWLPSLSEIGSFAWDHSIWGMSKEHRCYESTLHSALRSANFVDSSNVYSLSPLGVEYDQPVTFWYAIRPAIHLNLSAILENRKPTDNDERQNTDIDKTEIIKDDNEIIEDDSTANDVIDNENIAKDSVNKVEVTALKEIWNQNEHKFDRDNFQTLLSHIAGVPNATLANVDLLFSGKPIYTNLVNKTNSYDVDILSTFYNEYGSKVVKSWIINKNANKITPGIAEKIQSKGLTVTLKGHVFRVTSLTRTLPAADKPEGDIVATLMLKDPAQKAKWNYRKDSGCLRAEPSNMYATSAMRRKTLPAWQANFVGTDRSFAREYLVTPKHIGYQYKQSLSTRWFKEVYSHESMPNEALGDVGGFWEDNENFDNYSYDYYNDYDNDFYAERRNKYLSWGNDYVWLPSLCEVGSDTCTWNIWGICKEQICFSSELPSWLRTGDDGWDGYKCAAYLYPNGTHSVGPVTHSYGLRPAMHLNISAIANRLNIVSPTVAIDNQTADDKEVIDTAVSELWNGNDQKFNSANLHNLIDHLTGVKDATIENINTLFSGEPVSINTAQRETSLDVNLVGTWHQEYSSKVVKSDIINKNANKITLGLGDKAKSKGLTVTLKGEVFRVTSLTRTLPTADKPEGDIVVTLMLKDARQKLKWNEKEYRANKADEPTDMYGTSDIRKALIGANGWQDNYIGADNSFMHNYLIQPKLIGYQREQRYASRWRNYEKNNKPNEALDDVGNFCAGHDYYNNGDANKRIKYVSWGNDYFWLPSMTEIGGIESPHSVWGMALPYIVPEPGTQVWLRSASSSGIDGIHNVDSNGFNGLNNNAARINGLRPAMHLNLSAAIESLFIKEDNNTPCEDNAIECDDIGNCYELYNEQAQGFDQSNLRRLYSLLTGIDNADFDDVESLFQGEPMEEEDDEDYEEEYDDDDEDYDEDEDGDEDDDRGLWVERFGSKVVKSSVINANADKLIKSNGLTVTLKGKFFRVTSLTRTMPTDDNPEGDIVATLLLKEPERNVIWNSHDDQGSDDMEPSNMYGTSYIRKKILPLWLKKFIGDDINFPVNYLTQPMDIVYQQKEDLNKLNASRYSLPNDALSDAGTFYEGYSYHDIYSSHDYFNNGGYEKSIKYIAWGEDYIWLPSLTEVSCKYGIWGMASVGFENYSSAWLRSGYEGSPYSSYYISINSSENQTGVKKDNGLRPAMHLNLSAANRAVEGLSNNIERDKIEIDEEAAEKEYNPKDLWNADAHKFDNNNLQNLISRLTGIKNASMKDVAALFSGNPISITAHSIEGPSKINLSGTYHMEYRSKVVKWDLLRENAAKMGDNNGHGIIVILKGEKFIVTSLTKTIPTVGGNPNGNIVVTLLQLDPNIEVSWNDDIHLNNANEPSNMYGTSDIRKALIGAGGWQETFIGADENFANDYLIEPDMIDYQHKQSVKSRWGKRGNYNRPNEALGNVGGFLEDYDYYDTYKHKRNCYIAWGDDYVWLPSVTEIGSTMWIHSIWGTVSASQKTAWLRSSSSADYNYVYTLSNKGQSYVENVELRYLLRPALHLNLSAAANYWESNATDDLWDDQKHAFDADNLQTLYNQITGIKNATMIDIDALFRGNPIYTNAVTEVNSGYGDPKGTYHQEYSSKVVKSDLLNSNANKITPGIGDDDSSKGLCVTIKGRIFRVTSLTKTLPTAENPNGDIVATLLLKKPEEPTIWNQRSVKGSLDDEPPGMYGTSHIRKHVLPMWQNNFMGADTDFADKFLVQPNRIGYQHDQSMATRWLESGAFSLPNDALGNVGRYYHGAHTLENQEDLDYYNNGDAIKRDKYISWGNDHVWLPSLTETGSSEWTQSIWGMSTAHISFDYAFEGRAWLRSGEKYFGAIRYLNEQGYDERSNVYNSLDLRPAMHLNLSAADLHSTRWLPLQDEIKINDAKGDSIVEAPKDDSTEA